MTATASFPSIREVDLANHKLGSFLSGLEEIVYNVKAFNEDITPEEFLAKQERGEEYKRPVPRPTEELLALLTFATDLASDAAEIQKMASELRHQVLALSHEADDERRRSSWAEYEETLRAWHQEHIDALAEDRAAKAGDSAR